MKLKVLGIRHCDSSKLKFTWKSMTTFYSLIIVLVGIGLCCHYFIAIIIKENGNPMDSLRRNFFILLPTLSIVISIRVARSWPTLIYQFERIERKMYTLSIKSHLPFKLKIYILLSILIYLSILTYFYVSVVSLIKTCDALNPHMATVYGLQVVHLIKLNIELPGVTWYAMSLAAICIVFPTIIIQVEGILIILISITTQYFKQFNKKLELVKFRKTSSYFWRNMRESYNELSHLVITLDQHLCILVFLVVSFSFGNTFFVLYMFLTYPDSKYVLFLLCIVLGKMGFFLVIMASVNYESKQMLSVLYSVPNNSYNIEVERFIRQVHFQKVAISGCRLFNIDREFVVTVFESIITYTLIAFQFGIVSDLKGRNNPSDLCIEVKKVFNDTLKS
uniref:Gustatory receptor n=1 Tax=Clastoptera arizonana TaxID=38151 RepID=A0A1B6DP52_9HEMI